MTAQSFLPPVRTLMGPGPSDVHPRILSALARPTIGHLDPMFVAMMEDQVIGYGRVTLYNSEKTQARHLSPDGWYFMGMIIDQNYRRMGIGTHLSEHRIEWLKNKGAKEVFSFVNADNKASLDLHEHLDFEIVEEGPGFLNVDFDGGSGILFKKVL